MNKTEFPALPEPIMRTADFSGRPVYYYSVDQLKAYVWAYARAVTAQPVAWGIFGLVDGQSILQLPVRRTREECEADLQTFVTDAILDIRPLYAPPIEVAKEQA